MYFADEIRSCIATDVYKSKDKRVIMDGINAAFDKWRKLDASRTREQLYRADCVLKQDALSGEETK